MKAPTVTARCGTCGTPHPLPALAGLLPDLVGDGPVAARCPSCERVTPLDIRRPQEMPA